MESLDRRVFLDINHFAVRTGSLHEIGRLASGWFPLVVLIACLAAAWWRARWRPDAPVAVSSALWAGLGALVALAVAGPLAATIGRARPFRSLSGVQVLVGHPHSHGFPNAPVAAAVAVAAALWVSDRSPAAWASLAALVLAVAQVYVGVSYPGDGLGGMALGVVVALALRPLAMLVLTWLTVKIERSPLHLVVAAHRV